MHLRMGWGHYGREVEVWAKYCGRICALSRMVGVGVKARGDGTNEGEEWKVSVCGIVTRGCDDVSEMISVEGETLVLHDGRIGNSSYFGLGERRGEVRSN